MRALRYIFLWWTIELEERAQYFESHLFSASVGLLIWMIGPISLIVLLSGGWKWALAFACVGMSVGLLYLYPALKRAKRASDQSPERPG